MLDHSCARIIVYIFERVPMEVGSQWLSGPWLLVRDGRTAGVCTKAAEDAMGEETNARLASTRDRPPPVK